MAMTFSWSDAPASDGGTVVVAVLTYRRTEELAKLLPLLADQATQIHPPAPIVVVDNDPECSARDVVADVGPGVRYVHEPEPGIAAGRNRAIDEAAGAAALVFIDDDELPEPGWLASLVERWRNSGGSAVTGPVQSRFETAVDPWVVASGHFAEWEFGDGEWVPAAATNNLLLDLATVRRLDLRFDPAFGLSGGSDSRLTRELVRRGGRILWAPEARVSELVPPDRATKAWVCRRITRTANGWARVHLDLAPGPAERLRLRLTMGARAAVILARGLAVSSVGLVAGDLRRQARGRCEVARGQGLLVGLLGLKVMEYRRPG